MASGNEARALLAALCLVLGVFVSAASTLTFDRHAHRADVIETQLRILSGGAAVFAEDEVYLAAVMFGPIVLWLVHNRTSVDERHVGLICAAIGVSALSICFGLESELRRHIPALAVLLYVAVAAHSGWRVPVPRTSTA